jgi:hypothetical protein
MSAGAESGFITKCFFEDPNSLLFLLSPKNTDKISEQLPDVTKESIADALLTIQQMSCRHGGLVDRGVIPGEEKIGFDDACAAAKLIVDDLHSLCPTAVGRKVVHRAEDVSMMLGRAAAFITSVNHPSRVEMLHAVIQIGLLLQMDKYKSAFAKRLDGINKFDIFVAAGIQDSLSLESFVLGSSRFKLLVDDPDFKFMMPGVGGAFLLANFYDLQKKLTLLYETLPDAFRLALVATSRIIKEEDVASARAAGMLQ